MKKIQIPTFVDLASWCFCAFLSHNIIYDWTSFPTLHKSFLAFCIWLTPIFFYWLYPYSKEERYANPHLLCGGIVFSLLGFLGGLNFFEHLGLAFASVGLISWSKKQIVWLIAALAWFPASSYLFSNLPFNLVIFTRIIIVSLSVAFSIWTLYSDHILKRKGYDQQTI